MNLNLIEQGKAYFLSFSFPFDWLMEGVYSLCLKEGKEKGD